jgi:hypothetical protein
MPLPYVRGAHFFLLILPSSSLKSAKPLLHLKSFTV